MSDCKVNELDFHSSDADEVSRFIEEIHSENIFNIQNNNNNGATFSGIEWNGIAIYDASFEMPFVYQSGDLQNNHLVLLCGRGSGDVSNRETSLLCSNEIALPLSANDRFKCVSGLDGLDILSIVFSSKRLTEFTSNWIGHPLETPLIFDFCQISSAISTQWTLATHCLQQLMRLQPMPESPIEALFEHMLKILVTGHPNNYSARLDRDYYSKEQQVRAALDMIMTDPMRWRTLGAIAHVLECATSALEKGIRRLTGKGSTDIFYLARLRCLNRALSGGNGHSFVGTLHDYGFSFSERFIYNYTRQFGEHPSETYIKNKNDETCKSNFAILSEESINLFIDSTLKNPIGLSELSKYLGMSEYAIISAFKEQFSRTPMQYVIERRLEHARRLLINTSDSIASIAEECGFVTQSYFTTCMKKHYGVTPGRIRLSIRR
ncbi:helix-turn-helix transcriptional regulator [Burkholderia ubonensis]|uniref:helix-turn-helix transcriptional regulator n=1 Tax=Burkholderia ubonensis TaxID=101571 RepID=UPI0009B443DE|nr:AraC family transcriptional regulator [Burkholderia ubonensis]